MILDGLLEASLVRLFASISCKLSNEDHLTLEVRQVHCLGRSTAYDRFQDPYVDEAIRAN